MRGQRPVAVHRERKDRGMAHESCEKVALVSVAGRMC